MSSQYPVLNNKPIDQWKVTELKEELRKRKIPVRGLKEELIRKLDEAIRNEMAKEEESVNACNPDSVHDDGDQVQSEKLVDNHTYVVVDPTGKTGSDALAIDIDINQDISSQYAITATPGLDTKVSETKTNVVSLEDSGTETQTVITLSESSIQDASPKEMHDEEKHDEEKHDEEKQEEEKQGEEKHEDSTGSREDIKLNLSEPDNQVPVVSPDLGFQVKCESIPIDSVSIIEKNSLKDNLNADDFHLEQEVVKPEMVQPSSSSVIGGDLQPLDDDKGPVSDPVTLEETDVKSSINIDLSMKEENVEEGSPEKLNLDRCSSDELMEEDVSDIKHVDSNTKSEELEGKTEVNLEPAVGGETSFDGGLGGSMPEKKDTVVEDHRKPEVPAEKRKLEDREVVGSNGAPKRQRRWNAETVKVPEQQTYTLITSSPSKDAFHLTPRRTLTKSVPKPVENSQKERIVPPSPKPATTSLRIDRFLRPFTLKAVQELLAKTGTVCSFWMDHIKTHCYVTYSSVEEATATRNAVYNLQWPPNGGNLLVAEFVDPQDVKAHVEPPPQSAVPISPNPTTAKVTNFQQPQAAQPPTRQHSFRQPLPPLPTPTLSDLPAARERLPPPPPLNPEPPALTLDDLFKKTRATPRIYYLPLSEEAVASKFAAQGKNHKGQTSQY
ncbi:uncharacterized protein LOC135633575 [Musa acuminata AAA Group]|uniref:uncharacterized protein LOC135607981 n=1 Tax=Musa acuminata AAA Group TaxID=214697 RepID=UPI0031D5E65E